MNHAAPQDQPGGEHHPPVVTLCGSTRFKNQINAENARLTLEGNLVISLGVFGHADMPDVDWTTNGSDIKRMLDDLHLRKIDLADRVHVINPGGYIGESTRREIDYARRAGKQITYLHHPCDLHAAPTGDQPPTAGRSGPAGPSAAGITRAGVRAANRAAWAAGDSGAQRTPAIEPGHQVTGGPAEATARIAGQPGPGKAGAFAGVQALADGTKVVVGEDPQAVPPNRVIFGDQVTPGVTLLIECRGRIMCRYPGPHDVRSHHEASILHLRQTGTGPSAVVVDSDGQQHGWEAGKHEPIRVLVTNGATVTP